MHRSLPLFILIMLGVLVLMHFITYKVVTSLFVITGLPLLLLQGSIFFSISFLMSAALVRNYNNFLTRVYYRISSVWMGYLFYLFLASGIYGIVLGVNLITQSLPTVDFIGKILLGLGILFPTYALWKAHYLVVIEKTIFIKDLPETWRDRRAAFISDIHLGQIHGEKFATKVVKQINKLNPDIVFNTGDLFDGVKVRAEEIISPFKEIEAKLGTYFVLGNHEEYGDTEAYVNAIRKTGLKIIHNEKIDIEGLQIIGADYKTTTTRENLHSILELISIDKNIPSILLKHVPDHLDIPSLHGVSLHLSGHTHKAQVYPLNLITHRMFKGFDYGLRNLDNMQVLTTSGVGTWGPPLRFGSRSEIVLITFK